MIKKYLLRIILKLFSEDFREIKKISAEDEFKLFLLNNSDDTVKLIRSIMTMQVLKAFEADNETDRLMAKGAASILKIIKDAHLASYEIYKQFDNDDDRIKAWKKFKKINRTN